MDFTTYLNNAWNDHAKDADQVAQTFNQGLELIQSAEDLEQLGWLSTHVYGEHLGKWDEGLLFLNTLSLHSLYSENSPAGKVFPIYKSSLSLSKNSDFNISHYALSEQIRILAMSSRQLCGIHQNDRAQELFFKALEHGQTKISKEDSANRALAIMGNTIATTLEEKKNRNQNETDFMILAAKAARKYWEIAGTWLEVERAEYRLSQSYLKAGQFEESLIHAQNCIEISSKNSAPALEFFFGYEALALAEKKKSNDLGYKTAVEKNKIYFEQLSEDDKSWCLNTLEKFK